MPAAVEMDRFCWAVSRLASVTWTVKLLVPAVVGVPEIAPEEDSVRPAGRAPVARAQVYGAIPPVAFNCAL